MIYIPNLRGGEGDEPRVEGIPERKRILEVLGLDECNMEQVYRALGRDAGL